MPDPLAELRQKGLILKETGVNMAALADAKVARAVLPGMEPAEPGSTFEAVLPWPPSINKYYHEWIFGIVKQGVMWICAGGRRPTIRVALSPEAEMFRQEVALVIGQVRPLTGPLSASIVLFEPNFGKHDIDNFLKGLLDSMTHAGVYGDDKQIRRLTISYGPLCRPNGKVAVRIVPLAEA
jgi:crossover junction endodeoxyribonuclease RusA